jgi:hypothetical protein
VRRREKSEDVKREQMGRQRKLEKEAGKGSWKRNREGMGKKGKAIEKRYGKKDAMGKKRWEEMGRDRKKEMEKKR